ncbi:MAG: hypothetical protein Q7I99_03825 [Acholeplasmataceae bacterium]|nr:hypothetical protein [Acholeplasmataceae bacterium]
MKMKGSKKRNYNSLAIIAIIISIVSLVCDKCQDDKIEKQQYELSAINYRPSLVIDTIMFDSTYFYIKSANLTGEENDSIGLVTVNGEIHTKTKIRIKNTGNANAKVLLRASLDTICGLKKIRDEIHSLNYNFFPDTIIYGPPYYVEILPNKYYEFEFKNSFSNFDDNLIELHFFMLYVNEIGQLFDSYFWFKLKHYGLKFDIKQNIHDDIVFIENSICDVKLKLSGKDSIYSSTDIYSYKDQKKIRNFLSKLEKKSIKK